jgi:hypothetical protein
MIAPTTFSEDTRMSCTTIAELGAVLQNLLIVDAEQLGRASGFIQRQRKLSGASFVQSLVFGWQANPKASLEELCQSAAVCGVSISPQGLQERLNSVQATTFLQQMLEQSLTYLVTGVDHALPALEQFAGIYLQDSTTVALPSSLAADWRASGNQTGVKAGLKVQTVFNYQNGHLHLHLAEAVSHDCRLQTVELPAGSLRLADIGYFKVKVLECLNQRQVWWLTRLPARVGIWRDNQVMPIATWLAQQDFEDQLDVEVELTRQRFACRLIALRVPETVAAQRRQQLYEATRRRCSAVPRPETLALCAWTVMVTNLAPEQVSPPEALLLLRLRWQIELLFKLWKQSFALTAWHTHQPQQILTEVFAKLLLAVVQHWLLLLGCWGELDRSLFKAVLVLRKHAFQLAAILPTLSLLVPTLHTICRTLTRCSIRKRKARPATFQLLERTCA